MNRNIPERSLSPPPEKGVSTHDHEWEPEGESPYIEDGAAIFVEYCTYAVTKSVDMGLRGTEEFAVGPECDESRQYRFEIAWVEEIRPDEPNITYLASEFDRFPRIKEGILIDIELKGDITNIDPDPDYGTVTVEYDNWRAKYKADPKPQVDPHPR